ncbi:DNA cytosine methyltransferase [Terrabacter sp. AAH1]
MATFVELFAGCGGMSLGLEAASHTMVLANELSPMAAESYAYNLLGSDIRDEGFAATPVSMRPVLWLNSRYGSGDVRPRLDENPHEYASAPQVNELGESNLKGKLVVGDLRRLNEYVSVLKRPLLDAPPDIVSGGPPCQSFSMAGLRELSNHRNRLPWEFARFVSVHQPKLAILENVSGILRPFLDKGQRVYAWLEVAKAFATVGYAPICLHVNAKDAGVAQNRPRFIMIAVRDVHIADVRKNLGADGDLLDWGTGLLKTLATGEKVREGQQDGGVVDLTRPEVAERYHDGVLRDLLTTAHRPFTVEDAIGDLHDPDNPSLSSYAVNINTTLGAHVTAAQRKCVSSGLANNEHRRHTALVQARFRLYQRIEEVSATGVRLDGVRAFLRGAEGVGLPSEKELRSLLRNGPLRDAAGDEVRREQEVLRLVFQLRTRKRTQKALRRGVPAPAALSIPDDACHYSEPRTLSVREMARIQSFPDNFEFRSVPTTGGARRKYQVPQYTQVGNAVPPKLAYAVGRVAAAMLGESITPSRFETKLENSWVGGERELALVD